ncbi:MAG: hypothetical protein R3A47_06000 [Polyangiales bacterium]
MMMPILCVADFLCCVFCARDLRDADEKADVDAAANIPFDNDMGELQWLM